MNFSPLPAALVSLSVIVRCGMAATAPAGLTASEWSSLQQQLPPLVQQAYLKASDTRPYDYFGSSVAVSGDTVVIGTDDIGPGAVYIFARSGTNWVQQAYLTAPYPENNGEFGKPVAVSGDT